MNFVVRENGRNPVKNLPRTRFVHHETHMEGRRRELGTLAVGGERLTACATRPHYTSQYYAATKFGEHNFLIILLENIGRQYPYYYYYDSLIQPQ